MSEEPKPEKVDFLDMDFAEALTRFAQTKPEEVEPPPGTKPKKPRPQPQPRPKI